jgi:drug/metabolite transporter (DMT)-like permease
LLTTTPDFWGGMKTFFASPNDWVWLILLSLCCTVWAQSLAVSALRKLSSFTVTLSVNLEPLYGMALAFLFFDEAQELTTGFAWGVVLISLSVVLQMARVVGPGWAAKWVRWRSGLD